MTCSILFISSYWEIASVVSALLKVKPVGDVEVGEKV
jgi:hypothetical protein